MKPIKQQKPYLIAGWFAIGLSILIFALSPILSEYLPESQLNRLSLLGGWAGGVTAPLLSLAGFFMIYAAFRQQSQETSRAHQEFDTQRFEQTFFQLLNLYHQNLSSIEQRYQQEAKGDRYFFAAVARFLQLTSEANDSGQAYTAFYREHQNFVDHFARHVLYTIRFVAEHSSFADLADNQAKAERQKYLDILNAQMSTDELGLLELHQQFDPQQHAQGFQPYLTDYDFFQRLNR